MKALFKLALRNIIAKKVRFFILFLTFVLSAVTLMAAIFFKDAAIESREEQLRNNTLNSQIVVLSSNERDIYFKPEDVLNKIKNIEGIKYIVERCGGVATYKDEKINVVGVDFNKQSQVYSFNYINHVQLPASENQIVVSKVFSKKYGLNIGDVILLSTQNNEIKFKVSGIAADKGIFQGGNIVFVNIDAAQRLFKKEGLVYSIGITLKNLDSISDVANDIKKAIGSGYIVEERYDIGSYKAYVGTISMALSIFSAFAIFITLFLTYSTFKTVLYERISQIGTLRSLGATKMEIFISTYIESFIVITISTIIGLIVGFPFLHFILKLIVEDEIIMKFSILKFMLVFFMLLVTGFLSVILAILKIFKISVVDIIKGNVEKHTKKKNILKNYAGAVIIFVSLILLILSEKMDNGIFYLLSGIILFSFSFILLIEFLHILINNTLLKFINLLGPGGRLLNKEFKRDFSRSAESIILISIVIGIAYLSFTLSYLVKESVDKVYKGVDIVINTDSSMGSLDEKLSSISGVDKVVSQLRVKKRIRGMDVEISGIDPEKYKDFSFEIYKNGSIDELFKQLNYGKNIIITNTFAKNTNTKVGDYIQIKSKTKEKGEKYKVIGVVSSFENMGKVLFISKDNFIKDIGSNEYTLYLLKIKKNYNVSQVENGITEMLGKGAYYSINSLEEMKKLNAEDNNRLFLIVNALFLISVFISIFSLNNNLIINVLTQVRYFAIKRTVGMSLKQLLFSIICEGVIIGFEGGIFGLLFGFCLNLFIVKILSYYVGDLSFGYNYLVYLILLLSSIFIGFISSIYPFIKIRKINIVEAIKGIE
ncbi:ABC transporter permease [Thermoanaerobacter mathranii]|uniref:ABC transporter permease n=1 Tax=Thermoanaerobacter mathranii TaxID=583357 RepID=UPI003D6A157B